MKVPTNISSGFSVKPRKIWQRKILRGNEQYFKSGDQIVLKTNSNDSPDINPPSKLSLDPQNKANTLLTDHLEDSVVLSAADGTIKRLLPPLSRQQKEKVCSNPTVVIR